MFSIEESDEKALEIIKKAVGKVIDVTTACKDCPNWALVKELENYLRQHEDSIIKPKKADKLNLKDHDLLVYAGYVET